MVYEFGGGRVSECLGGIYEFLEKKKIANLQELELSKSPTGKTETKAVEPKAVESKPAEEKPRLSYAEQREREKAQRRARKKVEEAEAQITAIEAEIKAIEDRMSAGDTSAEICQEHAARTKALENAMSVWELATMEAEELN